MKNIRSNLPLLHSIRGVAALYVVVAHAKFILWSGGREYLSQYPRSGWNILDYFNFSIDILFSSAVQMVMVFFVLSGFFIAMSLDGLKGSMPTKLKTFYCIRIIRIYIPYLSSIIISILVLVSVAHFLPDLFHLNSTREFNNRLISSYKNLTFSNFAKSLIFAKNQEYIGGNLVYWSLLYEGLFYLVIPFVYQFKEQYLVISSILFLVGIFNFNIFHSENFLVAFLFQYNLYFAAGVALYVYRGKLSKIITIKNIRLPIIIVSCTLFLIFNCLALLKLVFWANLLAAFTTVMVMLLFLNYEIRNNFFMRILKSLGKISYSLYVIHFPVLIVLYAILYKITGHIFFYSHIYYPIGVLISVIVGYAFFKAVEAPSLNLIKKVKALLKKTGKVSLRAPVSEDLYPLTVESKK